MEFRVPFNVLCAFRAWLCFTCAAMVRSRGAIHFGAVEAEVWRGAGNLPKAQLAFGATI